jgi:hemolysin-activating ACP:hemolysin acyltransferase
LRSKNHLVTRLKDVKRKVLPRIRVFQYAIFGLSQLVKKLFEWAILKNKIKRDSAYFEENRGNEK